MLILISPDSDTGINPLLYAANPFQSETFFDYGNPIQILKHTS
ncbi:hypothetical protein SPWS13_0102 [Shewanella putrefaciens]|nr:hypothetical protein SPWS13_0102 [Shewanella putrefaciens]